MLAQGRTQRSQLEQSLREGSTTGVESSGNKSEVSSNTDPYLKELLAERDKRLQSEIRRLQAETVRLERDLRAKADQEKAHVLDAREREEKESMRRQRNLTDQLAELAVQRERLHKQLNGLQETRKSITDQLQSLKQEVSVYESGISAHRMRQRDLQSAAAARLRDEELSFSTKADALRARVERIRVQCKAKEAGLVRDLQALEALHHSEMERLDRAVVEDVQRKDADMDLLRDAVQTHKVKVGKLEKLLALSKDSLAGQVQAPKDASSNAAGVGSATKKGPKTVMPGGR